MSKILISYQHYDHDIGEQELCFICAVQKATEATSSEEMKIQNRHGIVNCDSCGCLIKDELETR